jgi:hypothetical protein
MTFTGANFSSHVSFRSSVQAACKIQQSAGSLEIFRNLLHSVFTSGELHVVAKSCMPVSGTKYSFHADIKANFRCQLDVVRRFIDIGKRSSNLAFLLSFSTI